MTPAKKINWGANLITILRIFLCVTVVSLASCAHMYGGPPATNFNTTGDQSFPSKNKNCKLRAYSTQPNKKFEEIGLISFDGWKANGGVLWGPNSPNEVIQLSQEKVCLAGGDALILWQANGAGNFKKATVIKFIE